MGLLMKSAPILVFLLACVNCVAADNYYIGPTVGGILGLVSENKIYLSI
jgi:hypothetical protein